MRARCSSIFSSGEMNVRCAPGRASIIENSMRAAADIRELIVCRFLQRMFMRKLRWVVPLLMAGCVGSGDAPAGEEIATSAGAASGEQPAARDTASYNVPIVLLVSPDSQEIERLKQQLGEDFYTVADDAMWYRASAYELLDSLQIPYAEVRRGAARFLVDGRSTQVSWQDVELTWFSVVYDGKKEPRFTADVDLRDVLLPSDNQ